MSRKKRLKQAMAARKRRKSAARIRLRAATTLANPDSWLREGLAAPPSYTGISINPETAMRLSAVYACVRVLAETVASLPLELFKRTKDGGKEPADDHPLYPLLHNLPNPEMTSFDVRENLMGHLALRGNAYSQIIRVGGEVAEIIPLHPARMTVDRDAQGRLKYRYRDIEGKEFNFGFENVWRITGLSDDGLIGRSPIALAREAIGLGLATEKFGAKFFAHGARASGVLEIPQALNPEAQKNLAVSFQKEYGSADNVAKVVVLEEGVKWQQLTIPPDDAQFLETRKYQIADIARIFRVPGVLLGLEDKTSTYASAEQFFLSFVVHTIRPWLVRWEQTIYRDLLSPNERRRHFAEFNISGLLRGDFKTRTEGYASAINWGWMNRNEVRALENLNPEDDLDEFLQPVNMTIAGEEIRPAPAPASEPAPAPANLGGPGPSPAAKKLLCILRENAARLAHKEAMAVKDKWNRPSEVREFMRGRHAEQIARGMGIDQGQANALSIQAENTLASLEAFDAAKWEADRAEEFYLIASRHIQ